MRYDERHGNWQATGGGCIRYGRAIYSTASLGPGGRKVALRRRVGTRTLRRYVPSDRELSLVALLAPKQGSAPATR